MVKISLISANCLLFQHIRNMYSSNKFLHVTLKNTASGDAFWKHYCLSTICRSESAKCKTADFQKKKTPNKI